MIYSKTCEYAIRCLMYFSDHPEKKVATVKEISKESRVPASYVAKIFQCLVRSRILTSQRGPIGGYSLVTPVSKLTVLEIVHALDDLSKSPFSSCSMGLDRCNDKNPCLLHPSWAKAKEQMLEELATSTIANVASLGSKFRWGRHQRSMLSKRMRDVFSL